MCHTQNQASLSGGYALNSVVSSTLNEMNRDLDVTEPVQDFESTPNNASIGYQKGQNTTRDSKEERRYSSEENDQPVDHTVRVDASAGYHLADDGNLELMPKL